MEKCILPTLVPGFVRLPIEKSGVYLLLRSGRVIYVGQSINILMRISKHRDNIIRYLAGKPPVKGEYGNFTRVIFFDEVQVKFAEPDQLDTLELELIDRFKPEFNVRLKRKQSLKIDLSKFGFEPDKWQPPVTKKNSQGLLRI